MLKIYLYISQPYLEVVLSVGPQGNGKGRPNPKGGGPEDVLVRKEARGWLKKAEEGKLVKRPTDGDPHGVRQCLRDKVKSGALYSLLT